LSDKISNQSAAAPAPKAPSKTRFRLLPLIDGFLLAEIVPQVLLYLIIVAGMFSLIAVTETMHYLTTGASVRLVAEMIMLKLPPYLVISFPMAVLLGAILAFTKISSDSESVALLAGGTSFKRMLRPVALTGFVVAAVGLLIYNTIAPASTSRLAYIKKNVLNESQINSVALDLPAFRTKKGKLIGLVHVEGGYDSDSQIFKNVYITAIDPNSGNIIADIHAKGARYSDQANKSWKLIDAVAIFENGRIVTDCDQFDSLIKMTPELADTVGIEDTDTLTFSQLYQEIIQLKKNGFPDSVTRQKEVSLWNKIAMPLASFFLSFIGAALGFRPQRSASRGISMGIGVLVIFSYYALFQFLQFIAGNGMISPAFAAFLPLILGTALSIYLVSKTTT
jgi:lipopolysaccharide export system permease protein